MSSTCPSRGSTGSAEDPPAWLEGVERQAWLGYRRMSSLLDLVVAQDLAADSGLSNADYDVLSTLSESPDGCWRLRTLADRLLWTPTRLSHQVSRMQRRGLVSKRPDPSDGRGTVVSLSRDGWSTLTSAAPLHLASVRHHFIDALSARQLAQLADIAQTLTTHLDGDVHVERPAAPRGEVGP